MTNNDYAKTYSYLLVEIKYRVEAIDDILAGRVRMRGRIAEESAYLQLRMICELIAIGCLIMHGDIDVRRDVKKTYKADRIINTLTALHPKAYPTPLQLRDLPGAVGVPDLTPLESGFLTKGDMLKLHAQVCGGALHRGNAVNILKNERPTKFEPIKAWRDQIVTLLTRHMFETPDGSALAVFIMENGKGDVAWNIFQQVAAGTR